MLLHEHLLFNVHATHVINLAVVDSKVKFSPVPRFENTVGNVDSRTTFFFAETTTLLKLYLIVKNRSLGYRESWGKYDLLAGP